MNAVAGLYGAFAWWRHVNAPGFWPLLRIGQALVLVEALDGVILLLLGKELPQLHLIYGLVPIAVSFVAEQLRLAAAETVLQQRDLEGRADVEKLATRRAAGARDRHPAPRDGRDGSVRGRRGASRGTRGRWTLGARMPLSNTPAQTATTQQR